MRYARAALLLLAIAVLAAALVARAMPAHGPPGGGQIIYQRAQACVAQGQATLVSAEAWAWTLCFDEGAACAQRLAARRVAATVGLWLACGAQAAGP